MGRAFWATMFLVAAAKAAIAGGPLAATETEFLRAAPGAEPPYLVWPLCADIGAGFGPRIDPLTGKNAFHGGVDIGNEFGLKVRAAAAGRVIAAERRGPYGLLVEIDHGDGRTTRYAQLQSALVAPGMRVAQNDVIATVGSSGRSPGPHLHFEVWDNGRPKDPVKLFNGGCILREGK